MLQLRCIQPRLLKGVILSLAISVAHLTYADPNAKIHMNFNVAAGDSIIIWLDNVANSKYLASKNSLVLKKAYNQIATTKPDSLKLLYLSKLQWTYMNIGDSLLFRRTNTETRKLAKILNDSVREAVTYWDLGTFYDRQVVMDSAYFYLSKAQVIFRNSYDNERAGRSLYEMAALKSKIRDNIGSEIAAIEAISLLKPLNDYLFLFRCYNLLGVVAKDLNEFERALDYYNTAIEYLQKIKGSEIALVSMQNNIGNVYRELQDYEKASAYYQRTLSFDSLEQKRPLLYARALSNQAFSNLQSGKMAKVESQLLTSLKIRKREEDHEGTSGSHYNLAQYYLRSGDSVRAIGHARSAQKYAKISSNNDRLLETLVLLAKLDSENAAIFFQEHQKLDDSLLMAERLIRNKFARIAFETDEVEAENIVLARQKQIWTGIAVGALLLTISVFIIISQRIKNQKLRFEQEQQEANNEIFSLMLSQKQKIEEGKKSEQKRISEELHDGVLGEMNGARMILVGLNKKTDENAIAMRSTAIAKLQEVQEEIRTISHELSDAAYQKFHNFIISIQELISSVAQTAKFEHNFSYNQEFVWDSLSAEIKINLYRIVQESLMNCVKHAQASNVELSFEHREKQLVVQIKDDGKGFNSRRGKKGIGHKNISSRIAKLNGNWAIESEVGKGTLVTVELPIKLSHLERKEELIQLDK